MTQRWWDGHGWTAAVQPVPPPPSGGLMPPGVGFPTPAEDLNEESAAGRRASLALAGGAVAYGAQYIVSAALFVSFYRSFRNWLNAPTAADGTKPPLVLPHLMALNGTSSLISLALMAVAVVFLMWFYKAVTVAERLGLPARWSPGWAIGSWFIPIVSLWFPYQSAVDCLPPGHPGRSTLKRWWALWIATQVMGVATAGIAFVGNSVLAWAAAVVGIVVVVAAAQAGAAAIGEINRVHAGLVGR